MAKPRTAAKKPAAKKPSKPRKQPAAKQPAKPKVAAKGKPKPPHVLEPVQIGATGLRQSSFVRVLSVSPDGTRIATGDGDGRVRVFDRASSACIFEAKWIARDHRGRHGIQRLRFSPDGAVITALTGINGHGNLCAAHIATGATWFETQTDYYSYTFSRNGAQIVAVRWGAVEVVNARDGTTTSELALPANVHPKELAWSPDYARIVVSFYDDDKSTTTSLLVLDGETFEVVASHDLGIDLAGSRLAFRPDGRLVTIVTEPGSFPNPSILHFDPVTGAHEVRRIHDTEDDRTHRSYDLLPARGQVLETSNAVNEAILSLDDARLVEALPGDTAHAAESADGAVAVTSHGVALRAWDREWNELASAPGLSTVVSAIAFSADGTRIVTGDNTSVRTWALDGSPLSSVDVGTVTAFSPDASCALVTQDDKSFVIDLPACTRRPGELESSRRGTFSPDGRLVVRGNYPEGKLELWTMPTSERIRAFDISGKTLYGSAFSPDGTLVAGGSWESSIRVFDVASGEQLTGIYFRDNSWGQVELAFTHDNALLVSGDHRRTVRLWKLPSGKLAHKLTGHRRSVIQATAFSRDGSLLASADEADIRLWHVKTGKPLAVARVGANSLAFSPDGAWLAAGGDGVAYLLDVSALR